MRMAIPVAALVLAFPALASADGQRAVAEMKGCTSPAIAGTATLVEQVTAKA